MSIQQLFFNGESGPTSPVTFTATGSFTVPSGVSSVTVKIFGAGGNNEPGDTADTEGGSGAYIIGTYAVQSGDIIHVYNAGAQTSYASSATWKRGATVMGWAVAGAGGSAGGPGDDGGDNWVDRYGGAGGDAGSLGYTANSGDSATGGGGGFGATNSAGGLGGGSSYNTGWAGGGPATSTGAASGGNYGSGGSGTNANGGSGGFGGGGYYGGGGGGGGGGRDDYPESGSGGGGGGGGTSYESGAMTSRTSGLCVDSSDANRGTAGNRGATGKVVMVF